MNANAKSHKKEVAPLHYASISAKRAAEDRTKAAKIIPVGEFIDALMREMTHNAEFTREESAAVARKLLEEYIAANDGTCPYKLPYAHGLGPWWSTEPGRWDHLPR